MQSAKSLSREEPACRRPGRREGMDPKRGEQPCRHSDEMAVVGTVRGRMASIPESVSTNKAACSEREGKGNCHESARK
ncbi:hypothetical protein KSC_002970 [Ktedonobacter sp. SOSP1-52]|nr:hypothetical protein KSC_002970 [Ktedonobacter sp. SOSP1-52]